ncbi:MAG: radical SAM protein [Theionarchaea archaeon]|nr:radical SAM protein [Theionarchaea archaeon]MBU7001184.1 radical SAM protein [Theionarchaea archaeon]MBU7034055.1 radical SAM protein [Theionarchaea archaeon]MBU7039590.1 radical SAM protein [Theionarchaea archaeon]
MLEKFPALEEGYTLLIQPFGGQIYLAIDKATKIGAKRYGHDVNVEGAVILRKCTGRKTVREIVDEICEEFDDVPASVEPKVVAFLNEAVEKRYVQIQDNPHFTNSFMKGTTDYITPFKAIVEVTSACNLRCIHCYGDCGIKSERELTTDELITILDQLHEMGTEGLNISGGEPLLRKDLLKILDYCHGKFTFSLLSNGTLIDDEFARKFAQYGSPLQVSIYGHEDEDHDAVTRVKGSFKATMRGVQSMVRNHVYVMGAYLYKPGNLDYIEEMAKFCAELGLAVFRVGALVTVGRGKDLEWEVTASEFRQVADILNNLEKEYQGTMTVQPWSPGGELPKEEMNGPEEGKRSLNCDVGSYNIVIGPNGDLIPCGLMRMRFGNLHRDDPRELFSRDHVQYFSTIEAPSPQLCGDCEFLYKCRKCHAEAASHFFRVEHCPWYDQFKDGPKVITTWLQEEANKY